MEEDYIEIKSGQKEEQEVFKKQFVEDVEQIAQELLNEEHDSFKQEQDG